MNGEVIEVRVHATRFEANGVLSFELRAVDGTDLPAFTAGSHIDLHLPNGLIRNYSLVNSQDERHRYVIAVSLDRNSRGGSRYLFDTQLVGQNLNISAPRNNFRLNEDASSVVLIAGGIGITPLYCMIQRLETLGKAWKLHYGARDRASAAFRAAFEALEAKTPGRVHFNFDLEDGHMLDVAWAVAEAPADAHLYCCGPLPMLEIYKAAATGRDPDTVHLEYFSAPELPPATGGAFTVELKSSGQTFEIEAGQSILDVLLDAGIAAPYSCAAGECGSCVVQVYEGEPEHHDCVLSDKERASNKLMMICVSGSKTKKLVIDL
jgi:vanillate O-demethylase ferredoxin subunit